MSEPTASSLAAVLEASRSGLELHPGATPSQVSHLSPSSTSASDPPTEPTTDGVLVIDDETGDSYFNYTEADVHSTTALPEDLLELRERCQLACSAVQHLKTVKLRTQLQEKLRSSPSSPLRAAGQAPPPDIDKTLQFKMEVVVKGSPTYEQSVGLEPTPESQVMEQEVRIIVKRADEILASSAP